ncbi:MAG: hypothetical protein AAF441_27905 [Pseudomonadota bacterium]
MSVIIGTVNSDTLNGTADDDVIKGRKGDDFLFGLDGNDKLRGGQGNDVLDGGAGDDNIKGGAGDDRIVMSSGTDVVRGGSGADVLAVSGDAGYTDWRDFEVGVDKIELGISVQLFDLLVSIGSTGNNQQHTLISFGNGEIKLKGVDAASITSDSFTFVEPDYTYINGTPGNDTIFGQAGDDFISGGAGNDQLSGSFGNDVLLGEDGDDRMFGALGDDILSGGDGDDRIQPGPGDNDIIFGGAGADNVDLYLYFNPDWSTNATWMDFEDGIDTIQISGIFEGNFDQVSIADDGKGNTLITYDTISFTLNGISAADVTADDFVL